MAENSFVEARELTVSDADLIEGQDYLLAVVNDNLRRVPIDRVKTGGVLTDLEADTTLYVRSAGNDANDGLTIGTAVQTWPRALDLAKTYNYLGFTLTLDFESGTFAHALPYEFGNFGTSHGQLVISASSTIWEIADLIGDIATKASLLITNSELAISFNDLTLFGYNKTLVYCENADVMFNSCRFVNEDGPPTIKPLLLASGGICKLRVNNYIVRLGEMPAFLQAEHGAYCKVTGTQEVSTGSNTSLPALITYAWLIADTDALIEWAPSNSVSIGATPQWHYSAVCTNGGKVIGKTEQGYPREVHGLSLVDGTSQHLIQPYAGNEPLQFGFAYTSNTAPAQQIYVAVAPVGDAANTGLSPQQPITYEELIARLKSFNRPDLPKAPSGLYINFAVGTYTLSGDELDMSHWGPNTIVFINGEESASGMNVFEFADTDGFYFAGGAWWFTKVTFRGGGDYGWAIMPYGKSRVYFNRCRFEQLPSGVIQALEQSHVNFIAGCSFYASPTWEAFVYLEGESSVFINNSGPALANKLYGDVVVSSGLFTTGRAFNGNAFIHNGLDTGDMTSLTGPHIAAYSKLIYRANGNAGTELAEMYDIRGWQNIVAYGRTGFTPQAKPDHGQAVQFEHVEELIAPTSGATSTISTVQIPAHAVVLGVSARTVSTDGSAMTTAIGDCTTPDKFISALADTMGATDPGTKAGPTYYATATNIVLTYSEPSSDNIAIRITAHYYTIKPPSA